MEPEVPEGGPISFTKIHVNIVYVIILVAQTAGTVWLLAIMYGHMTEQAKYAQEHIEKIEIDRKERIQISDARYEKLEFEISDLRTDIAVLKAKYDNQNKK